MQALPSAVPFENGTFALEVVGEGLRICVLMISQKIPGSHERNIETEGSGGHQHRNGEDKNHHNSACKCRLKKLHVAFQGRCTLSNKAGAFILPPDGGSESQASLRCERNTAPFGRRI